MKSPASVRTLENFGRTRLSQNFFMRDFLYSEISQIHRLPNIPDNPDLAIKAGSALCQHLLEPLNATFGRLHIRGSLRCQTVNAKGAENKNQYNCAKNENAFSEHIWDHPDKNGQMGATSCIVIPWFADRYAQGADWRSLAWWIHDHLDYSELYFHPKLCAFNISWHDSPKKIIKSYVVPRGTLTKRGMDNWHRDHSEHYPGFPDLADHEKFA